MRRLRAELRDLREENDRLEQRLASYLDMQALVVVDTVGVDCVCITTGDEEGAAIMDAASRLIQRQDAGLRPVQWRVCKGLMPNIPRTPLPDRGQGAAMDGDD